MNKDTEKRSSHPVMKRPFFHIKTPPKRTWKGQKDTLRYIKLSVFIFPNGGFTAHLPPPALVIFQKCFHAQTLNAILPEKVPGRIDVVYTIDMFVFIKQVMKLRTHHCVYLPGKYFGSPLAYIIIGSQRFATRKVCLGAPATQAPDFRYPQGIRQDVSAKDHRRNGTNQDLKAGGLPCCPGFHTCLLDIRLNNFLSLSSW